MDQTTGRSYCPPNRRLEVAESVRDACIDDDLRIFLKLVPPLLPSLCHGVSSRSPTSRRTSLWVSGVKLASSNNLAASSMRAGVRPNKPWVAWSKPAKGSCRSRAPGRAFPPASNRAARSFEVNVQMPSPSRRANGSATRARVPGGPYRCKSGSIIFFASLYLTVPMPLSFSRPRTYKMSNGLWSARLPAKECCLSFWSLPRNSAACRSSSPMRPPSLTVRAPGNIVTQLPFEHKCNSTPATMGRRSE